MMMHNNNVNFRREIFGMYELIRQAANHGSRLGEILKDESDKKKIDEVLNKLSKLDKAVYFDIKALDEAKRVAAQECGDEPGMAKKFAELRAALINEQDGETETDVVVGQCSEYIEGVRSKLFEQRNAAAQNAPSTSSSSKRTSTGGPEMEVLSNVYSDKDPITKKKIKDPVKNTICEHVYDRESITDYMNQCKARRQLCQCPVRSCPNKKMLNEKQMVPFPELFNLIAQE